MQKNKRHYTFLLKHSSKSLIRFRRFEISKLLVHTGLSSFAAILTISAVAAAYLGGQTGNSQELPTTTAAITTVKTASSSSIDYSRPTESNHISSNAGGPSFDIEEATDQEIEDQLTFIQSTHDPANIPSMWAHMGKINNEFGFRRNPFGGRNYEFHGGMDIDGERGDQVVAPANGTIVKAGWQGGYGNLIEIDHGMGLTTRYGHLSKIEVAVGDTISRGQLMGYVGSTGRSTGPHLHYELRLNDKAVNPRRFLPPEPLQFKRG